MGLVRSLQPWVILLIYGNNQQGYGFSSGHVWMWKLDCEESWALKNWCFWTVILGKTLDSPFNCKEILKEINPEYLFEGLMLKLKLQYFDHLCEELTHLKRPWFWERLMTEGVGDDRGQDGWMASPIQWTWVWASSRKWWRTGKPDVLQSTGSQRVKHDWATEQQYFPTQYNLNWEDSKHLN